MTVDPADLTARLVRCPSVTPHEGGALELLGAVLGDVGFETTRVDRGGVPNLYARHGPRGARTFGFNGHTDVVPPGDPAAWTHDPFSGTLAGGEIWGRGAVDMKSAVAAFAAAATDFVARRPADGAVALLITGDEEGPGRDGTRAILDWMAKTGERLDVCLVGEPTCVETLGDTIKIGRRGSLTARVTATGQQGHAAYPHLALNPLPVLVRFLDRVAAAKLDAGTEHFDASSLQLTTVDVGNPASNVTPGAARATLNIRFNDRHTGAGLGAWLSDQAAIACEGTGIALDLDLHLSGEAFLTPPGPLPDLVSRAVEAETGLAPRLSTGGGTSDARFVKDHCPVVEFGLVGRRMHAVDERVPVAEVQALTAIYRRALGAFFA